VKKVRNQEWQNQRPVSRSARKKRAQELVTKVRVWWGNKYLTHTKMKARRQHEKTSTRKMRFLEAAIAPVMRMSERRTAGSGLKEPINPSG